MSLWFLYFTLSLEYIYLQNTLLSQPLLLKTFRRFSCFIETFQMLVATVDILCKLNQQRSSERASF